MQYRRLREPPFLVATQVASVGEIICSLVPNYQGLQLSEQARYIQSHGGGGRWGSAGCRPAPRRVAVTATVRLPLSATEDDHYCTSVQYVCMVVVCVKHVN